MASLNYPPVSLMIRFSLPIPDLPITVLAPDTINPQILAHVYIRPHLPSNYVGCPLRLIHSGALLPPKAFLSTSLRLPKLEFDPHASPGDDETEMKATYCKGKGKDKEDASSSQKAMSKNTEMIYIHCAITTTASLSTSDLAAESAAASPSPIITADLSSSAALPSPNQQTSVPVGFDRLTSAGFTQAEIAALRSQFVELQAHTHMPDTMPNASELRAMEDRWLDNGAYASTESGEATGTESWDDESGGAALDDILWGSVMGFFWAIGSVLWLIREEGVW